MENNEKNLQGESGEKKTHGRHRPRHRRKPSNPAARENAPAKETTSGESTPSPKKEEAGQKSGNNNRNHNKNRRGGRSHGGRSYETRGPIDPYQEAEETAAALAELRAMIVLKSAEEVAEETVAPEAPVAVTEEETVTVEETVAPTVEKSIATDAPLTPAPEEETPIEPEEEPVEVVGIRFRSAGKIYYFDPQGKAAQKGEFAIVETARGPEFGDVALSNRKVSPRDVVAPLRPILRIATKEDIARNEENRRKEKEAFDVCRKKILEHKLDMKLIEAQYAFDNSKLLFYFTSDGRVDFRELVKDLASVFRTRIELRQIGIRDEAKMLGGFGACGRLLCCSTFLPDFAQVSIKMAKEQNLSLNSAKISGVCGRLMCCLRYETEVYAMESRLTPAVNSRVRTEDGVGFVTSTSPIAGTVTVTFRNGQETSHKTYHRDNVTVLAKDEILEEKPVPASLEEKPAPEAPAQNAQPRRSNSSRGRGSRGGKRNDDTRKNDRGTENPEK